MMKFFDKLRSQINEEIIDKFLENAKVSATNIADYTEKKAMQGYEYSKESVEAKFEEYKKSKEPISDLNWYSKAANSCEDMSDAFMRQEGGTSTKLTKGVVGKLGAAGTSVGIFSLASLIGTAGTGTAIGSLSSAAFTNASLAWLGGSMFMGSIIIGVASIVGGIGAVLGAGWVFKNYIHGKARKKCELELKDQRIIDVCLSLAAAFRQKANEGGAIDPIVANAIYKDALQPLYDDLCTYNLDDESWTSFARNRYKNALVKLQEITTYLKNFSTNSPNVTSGVVSAVILQLLAYGDPNFSGSEEIVLDALRRSNNSLTNATNEELSIYIQNLEPKQIVGLTNNIKGIYHEMKYANNENTDGDEFIVELFEATNHAGADVKLINTVTGEVKEIQLKATDFLSYIREHNEKYEDIEVFATSEIASRSDDIASSGISNESLEDDVLNTFDELGQKMDSNITTSMTVAALITLARNSRVLLRGNSLNQLEKEAMVKDGVLAAGTAALVTLVLG